MCLLCVEIQKELMSPRDFWKNYREVSDEHMSEVIEAVTKTSIEYQAELANGAKES